MSINFNFAGNISSYEARLQVARTLLAHKIEQLAAEKHIFFLINEETELPAVIVDSPILRCLADDYNLNTLSGLAVVRTKWGMGKTTAARIMLHYASRGILFHGGEVGDTYWRTVTMCLGLPENIPPTHKEWTQVLV